MFKTVHDDGCEGEGAEEDGEPSDPLQCEFVQWGGEVQVSIGVGRRSVITTSMR